MSRKIGKSMEDWKVKEDRSKKTRKSKKIGKSTKTWKSRRSESQRRHENQEDQKVKKTEKSMEDHDRGQPSAVDFRESIRPFHSCLFGKYCLSRPVDWNRFDGIYTLLCFRVSKLSSRLRRTRAASQLKSIRQNLYFALLPSIQVLEQVATESGSQSTEIDSTKSILCFCFRVSKFSSTLRWNSVGSSCR
jgi:hypothetical protein